MPGLADVGAHIFGGLLLRLGLVRSQVGGQVIQAEDLAQAGAKGIAPGGPFFGRGGLKAKFFFDCVV